VIAAILRVGKLVIPRGDTMIRSGDIVAVIGKEEAIRKVAEILRK
jgi:Trk K+ transport system NAD-binding subunit